MIKCILDTLMSGIPGVHCTASSVEYRCNESWVIVSALETDLRLHPSNEHDLVAICEQSDANAYTLSTNIDVHVFIGQL